MKIQRNIEALAYAKEHIRQTNEFFTSEQSREFVRRWLRVLLWEPRSSLFLIAAAREGDPEAQRVLADELLACDQVGLSPPTELAAYRMDVVAHMVRPRRGPGPDERNTLLRDIAICATVAAVCDRFGLKPTQRSARTRSGCAIVAEALSTSYKTVERAWKRFRRNMMPPRSGWTTFALENKVLP